MRLTPFSMGTLGTAAAVVALLGEPTPGRWGLALAAAGFLAVLGVLRWSRLRQVQLRPAWGTPAMRAAAA